MTTLSISQILEYLLPFSSQSFLFPFDVFEYKDRTIILPAILYGCDTWSLTLRRALESRALREDI
jgi:hypothetical protein